jgi:hypothetical protein
LHPAYSFVYVANGYFNDTITKDSPIACCPAWNKYWYKINLRRAAVFRKPKGDSARRRSVRFMLVAAETDCCLVDASSRDDSRLKTRWMKPPPDLKYL